MIRERPRRPGVVLSMPARSSSGPSAAVAVVDDPIADDNHELDVLVERRTDTPDAMVRLRRYPIQSTGPSAA
jgi:hypothetical protein